MKNSTVAGMIGQDLPDLSSYHHPVPTGKSGWYWLDEGGENLVLVPNSYVERWKLDECDELRLWPERGLTCVT